MKIPPINLTKQYHNLKGKIDQAISQVMESGHFILGPEVAEFEKEFAAYLGVKYAIGCGSGTAALEIAVLALDLKAGDEVILPSFTFIATAEAVSTTGAKVVFADIDLDNYTISPDDIRAKVTSRTRAIIPVHLYGVPCPMDEIQKIAQEYNLSVIEDCAQCTGGEYKGRKLGSIGTINTFSFFPTKNLGAAGDGGMVVTDDEKLAKAAGAIRVHGSYKKYFHDFLAKNSRLDELQAAILRVKLPQLDKWNEARRNLAHKYTTRLKEKNISGIISFPNEVDYGKHVYHLYVIRAKDRDGLAAFLKNNGIITGIHYPVPLHQQKAYQSLGYNETLPQSEKAAREIISLPLFPELTEAELGYVVEKIAEYYT